MKEQTEHWYHVDSQGQAVLATEVPSKDGSRMVKATLTHARKLGLLPSVSKVRDDVLGKGFQLVNYIIDQHLTAALKFPYTGDASNIAEVNAWKSQIEEFANIHRQEAADRGKEIHGLLNVFIETGMRILPEDQAARTLCEGVREFVEFCGGATDISTETALASRELGFAGTPDMVIRGLNYDKYCEWMKIPLGAWPTTDRVDVIVDLKTTNLVNYRSPHDTWKYQLGGYNLLAQQNKNTAIAQLVCDRNTGQHLWHDYTNVEQWTAAFSYLFEIWMILKRYDPRQKEENTKEEPR